jgi:hypothetical protein
MRHCALDCNYMSYVYIIIVISCNLHRWALLLKQQLLIVVYRLPTKEKKLPFNVSVCSNKWKFAITVFR